MEPHTRGDVQHADLSCQPSDGDQVVTEPCPAGVAESEDVQECNLRGSPPKLAERMTDTVALLY